MNYYKKLTQWLLVYIFSVMLIACGGGGGGSASTPPSPSPKSSSSKEILKFFLPGRDGPVDSMIDHNAGTINIILPFGSSLTEKVVKQ